MVKSKKKGSRGGALFYLLLLQTQFVIIKEHPPDLQVGVPLVIPKLPSHAFDRL